MSCIAVTVAPVQGGWSVLSPLSGGPLMFLSGDDAEEQGLRLAKLAAGLGWDAEVRLHHRDGEISVQTYAAHGAVTPVARGAPTHGAWRQGRVPPTRLEGVFSRKS